MTEHSAADISVVELYAAHLKFEIAAVLGTVLDKYHMKKAMHLHFRHMPFASHYRSASFLPVSCVLCRYMPPGTDMQRPKVAVAPVSHLNSPQAEKDM